MVYIISFIITFLLAIGITPLVIKTAKKYKIVDIPKEDRKIHKSPKPLLGGLAIFLSFIIVLLYFIVFTDYAFGEFTRIKNLFGLIVGGVIIMVGGYLDDKYNFKPWQQLISPILACLFVIGFGIGINYISHPFHGLIYLDKYYWVLFWKNGIPYTITLFADIFTFIWLMIMMYTTKFLDGLDGLVSGIGGIGGLIIFFLSITAISNQPETALISIIFAAACFGFLVFNFNPAKIFLGEGGSLFIGFMLGSLAIVSGGKIATTLLILGIPLLDAVWVVLRRVIIEKKSPFKGDKRHLHHRLLEAGLTHRQAVLILYFITLSFGVAALFSQGFGQWLALAVLVFEMLIIAGVVIFYEKRIKLKKYEKKLHF